MGQIIKSQNCINNDLSSKNEVVLAEIYQASTYLKLMRQQLVGALKDTEGHVTAIIECFDGIWRTANNQKKLISESLDSGLVSSDSNEAQLHQRSTLIDSSPMQTLYAESNSKGEVMLAIQAENKEIITHLSEGLGHLQFQDTLRQRIEQVQSAIQELDQHFLGLADHINDSLWDGQLSQTLKERMESHVAQYVMESQREVYKSVIGSLPTDDDNGD